MNPDIRVPVKQVPAIQANDAGVALINKLLDLALKGGGLEALNAVNAAIQTVNRPPQGRAPVEPEKKEKDPKENIIPIRDKKKKE